MPWLRFGGNHAAAIAEAARRAVAAELKVRPDEIELDDCASTRPDVDNLPSHSG
ncbi:MAG: hypothetical protein K0S97_228 [Chloroflexota bacterium]|nr:hypothetical protein [Chloroflexota bacterium]